MVKKMKIKEYLSMVYLNITRKGLKNNLYIATFICTILFFTLFVFWENVNKIISVTLKNEIGCRTIDVLPRFDSQDLTYDEINNKLDDEINEIMKINNIIDAFNSNEWNIVLTSDLDNQYVDGTITLLRGTKETLPNVIEGRTFDDNETGVAICPKNFYPDSQTSEIDKKGIINDKDLIDTIFSVNYNDYILNNFFNLKENNTYTKKFKIIGVYNSSERLNDINACYISSFDIKEIAQTLNSWNINYSPIISVVINDIDNIDVVNAELKENNFESLGMKAYLDRSVVNTIYISISVVFFLIFFALNLITFFTIKKNLKKDKNDIGILRTIGFSKKGVTLLYTFEQIIVNFIIYVIGLIFFIILYILLISNIKELVAARIMLNGFAFSFKSIILTFSFICIIPVIVVYLEVYKYINTNITYLIKVEE